MVENMHTRTPWRTQGWVSTWAYIPVTDARHNMICSMYPDTGHNYTRDEVEANAAFLVRAANNHDDLVAVAQEAMAALEYAARGADVITSNKLAETMDRINAALERAGA